MCDIMMAELRTRTQTQGDTMNTNQIQALIRILVNHGFIVTENNGFVVVYEPTRSIDVDDLRVTDYASQLIDLIPTGYIFKSDYQTVLIG